MAFAWFGSEAEPEIEPLLPDKSDESSRRTEAEKGILPCVSVECESGLCIYIPYPSGGEQDRVCMRQAGLPTYLFPEYSDGV